MTHETYLGQMASHHFTSEHYSHLSIDAARFGQSYMSKLGWDPSKGLGASGDGMKSHLKVSQKLDMLGIGAAHQKDPHGIAWKQNKEFEALLQRLNAQDGRDSTSNHVLGEFVRPEHPAAVAHPEEDKEPNQSSKKEKKRKHKGGEHAEDGKDKKKRKKDKRQDEDIEDSALADSSKPASPHTDPPAPSPDTVSSILPTRQKGRPMA
jgi:Pin2-interacting protein X1